jgi:Na+/proline symporter
MQWDLGLQGIGVLMLLALGFGVFTQLMFWSRTTWWAGLIGTAAYFVAGLLISEVWFGWATQAELQPNIDGLSFDEVLLGYVVAVPIVLVTRYLTRRNRRHRLRRVRGASALEVPMWMVTIPEERLNQRTSARPAAAMISAVRSGDGYPFALRTRYV